jgi:hypothetical protein
VSDFHGWTNDQRAVFLSQIGPDHIGLHIQQDRDIFVLADFRDEQAALVFQHWMDEVLTRQAETNAGLLATLQNEQPLLFAQGGGNPMAEPEEPMDATDLDDD